MCTHLVLNCAMKVKSCLEDVDQLIAKVKSATVKNKIKQTKLANVVSVVIRWESWLKAAKFYAKNLPEVKAIVERFIGSDMFVNLSKCLLANNRFIYSNFSKSKSYINVQLCL